MVIFNEECFRLFSSSIRIYEMHPEKRGRCERNGFWSHVVLISIYRLLYTGLVEDRRAVPDLFSQSSSRSTYLILHNDGELFRISCMTLAVIGPAIDASWATVPGYR